MNKPYPHSAARGQTDTSAGAADAIEPKRTRLHKAILRVLREHPEGLTTEEISNRLYEPFFSVQPRTSELRALSLIVDTGERRENQRSNRLAIVWGYVDPKERS